MTNNVNKIILVGHLGHTPELKITQGGRSMLQFSLATNTEFKNAAGGTTKEVHWHRAKVWGKRAEGLANHLVKGARVYVEGELRMNDWVDKEGVKRKSAEIHVDDLKFLGGVSPSGITKNEDENMAAAVG